MVRKKRRGKRKMTVPIAPIAGLVPMVARSAVALMNGDIGEAQRSFLYDTIGVDEAGMFHLDKAIANVTPLVAGLLIHKFVGGAPLNFNRILARAGVPFIRI